MRWNLGLACAVLGVVFAARAGDAPPAEAEAERRVLTIPPNTDTAAFKALMAGRKDWTDVVNHAGRFGDEWLAALAECPDLASVTMARWGGGDDITAAGVARLAACPKLRVLQLPPLKDGLDDAALAALVEGCPAMEEVRVAGRGGENDVSAEALPVLGRWTKLRAVRLPVAGGDDRALAALADGCPDLAEVAFRGEARFGAPGLAALAKLPGLTDIALVMDDAPHGVDAWDAALTALAGNCPGLRTLELGGATAVSDAGLAAFRQAPNLQALHVRLVDTAGDAGVRALTDENRSLRRLRLQGGTFTDEGAFALARQFGLRELILGRAPGMTDAGLLALAGLPRLDTLHLSRATGLTAAGMDAATALAPIRPGVNFELSVSPVPDGYDPARTALNIDKPMTVDEFRRRLGDRRDWRDVRLHNTNPTDEWLQALAECPDLRSLVIWNDQEVKITDAGVRALAACGQMRALGLVNLQDPLSDATLIALAEGCPELVTLDLTYCPGQHVTPAGVEALGKLTKLRRLGLAAHGLSGDALAALARGCPDLTDVTLFGLNGELLPGDAELAALAALPRLMGVNLSVNDVGDAGLQALVRDRPHFDRLTLGRGAQVTDAGLQALAASRALTHADLHTAGDAGDAGVAPFLRDKPFLQYLSLYGAPALGAESIAAINALPALRTLSLDASRIENAGLAGLAPPALFTLWLGDARRLDGPTLLTLGRNARLFVLSIRDANALPDSAEERFRRQYPTVQLTVHRDRPRARAEARPAPAQEDRYLRDAVEAGAKPDKFLRIPADADAARFEKLVGGRTDWEAVRCDSPHLTDAWMERIVAQPNLLSFSNTSVNPKGLTAGGMALLGRAKKLKRLELCSANALDNDGLERIALGCPDLERLWLCDSGDGLLTDEGLEALAACPKLRRLAFQNVREFGDRTLFALVNAGVQLGEFSVPAERTRFTDAGFEAFGVFAHASYLHVNAPDAGDAGLAALARHARALTVLEVKGAVKAGDAGFAALAALPALRHLSLPDVTRVAGTGFAAWRDHAALNALSMPAVEKLDDEGAAALARIPALHSLDLREAKGLTDAGLLKLADAPALAMFWLHGAELTDAGVVAAAARAQRWQQVRLYNAPKLTDAALDALTANPQVTHVRIEGARGISAAAVERFKAARGGRAITILPPPRGGTGRPGDPAGPPPPAEPDLF